MVAGRGVCKHERVTCTCIGKIIIDSSYSASIPRLYRDIRRRVEQGVNLGISVRTIRHLIDWLGGAEKRIEYMCPKGWRSGYIRIDNIDCLADCEYANCHIDIASRKTNGIRSRPA